MVLLLQTHPEDSALHGWVRGTVSTTAGQIGLRADAKTTSHFRAARSPGADGVVAGGLGVVMADRKVLHFFVGDLDTGGIVGLDQVGIGP